MMDSLNFYVFLLIAIIAGWLMGRFNSVKSAQSKSKGGGLFDDYFVGLNYLLNDEPDEAIDTFIKALEINSETVETHLALGTLLRRRGKVDKAIKVHQALLARPNLKRNFSDSAKLQLSLDYIAAGLLGRAERLLNEILDEHSEARWEALRHLITIYQTENEWNSAIACSIKLLKNPRFKKNPQIRAGAAHYCCEIAEQCLSENQNSKAKAEIKRAFTFDKKNIRAMLLLAKLEQRQGKYKASIKKLLRVGSNNPEFTGQLLQPLAECYEQTGEGFEKLLRTIVAETANVDAVLTLAQLIKTKTGSSAAINFLSEQLSQHPSLEGLIKLFELQIHSVEPNIASSLESLLNLVDEQMRRNFEYQCLHCGFESKSLFWMCPSCKKWDNIRPIAETTAR